MKREPWKPLTINMYSKTKSMDLIVIGVIDIHTVMKTSLKAGVTNVVSEYTEKFSGSALHVAVNASLLKAEVGIISPVGRDAVGLMDVLKRNQVDFSHVVLSSQKNPNFIELYAARRHYTLYYKGALMDFNPEKFEKSYLKKARAVHICFPDQKVTDSLVTLAKKARVLTSVDGKCAEADADIVFTDGNGEGKNTIVTDFEKKIICNGKEIPVFKNDTYHKEGVRDAFIAAFLTRYVKSEHAEHAALYGSCAAYLCSQSEKKVLTCTKEELDALFEEKMEELQI